MIIALVGALLIIRPGAEFQPGSLLAVLSGLLFAAYLVTTRTVASTTEPVDALRFQCLFGALLLLPPALFEWAWPTWHELLLLALMGVVSAICHFLVITAFRHAEAAVLSPLVYLELTTAAVLGVLIFGELPDVLAAVGISLIVAAGMLTWVANRAAPVPPRSA
jgi:drug/metabolite transporter (DMT)-like permease